MIDSFTGVNRFLSNFWPAHVRLNGEDYPTVEHAFQAAKTLDPAERKSIRDAQTPGEAKRRGMHLTLRPDWDKIKEGVMYDLLRQKFSDSTLGDLLRSTGAQELVEGNSWKDTYWGVYQGRGENRLGRLLMRVRDTLVEPEGEENRKSAPSPLTTGTSCAKMVSDDSKFPGSLAG